MVLGSIKKLVHNNAERAQLRVDCLARLSGLCLEIGNESSPSILGRTEKDNGPYTRNWQKQESRPGCLTIHLEFRAGFQSSRGNARQNQESKPQAEGSSRKTGHIQLSPAITWNQ